MALNVKLKPGGKHDHYELLAWLNTSLQTRFSKVEQTCSGAAFCQLMDLVFPGSVDLHRVRFQAAGQVDFRHNYNVLQASFRRTGVVKSIPIKDLIRGSPEETLDFLQWFKTFFDSNHSDRDYNALEARGGQTMLPAKPPPRHKALTQLNFSEKVEVSESPCRTLETAPDAQTGQSRVERKKTTEEEEKEGMEEEEKKDMEEEEKEDMEEEEKEDMEEEEEKGFPPCSLSMLRFIQKHRSRSGSDQGQVSRPTARHILRHQYPQDISTTCSHTPYCLYLYRGVELGEGETASVALIGYFHQGLGVKHVSLLDALQPRDETSAAELDCLVETLKRFELPAANLAMFYCNGDAGSSEVFVAGLRALNPEVMSLCGVSSLAGRACHQGVTALTQPVLELLKDIHHHNFTCSGFNDNLKVLFADIGRSFNPLLPVSSQCLFLGRTAQKMSMAWSDLVQYFESRNGDEGDAEQICARLRDLKLRLALLFLGHALEPLCAFQEAQEGGDTELAGVLREASVLLHSYATSFLHPPAVERFLRRRDPALLDDERNRLPGAEINAGGAHVQTFLSKHKAELAGVGGGSSGSCGSGPDWFLEDAFSFYKAVTQSLAESLPLSDVGLSNMAVLLRPGGRMKVKGRVVAEMGAQIGLCGAQLTEEYLVYMSKTQKKEAGSVRPGASMEEDWGKVLRSMGRGSILRRLILSLLAVPRSLHRDTVFAQAFERNGKEGLLDSDVKEVDKEDVTQKPALLDCDEDEVTDDSQDGVMAASPPRAVRSPESLMEPLVCDSSSDVIDLTDVAEPNTTGPVTSTVPKPKIEESILIDDDEDDDDVICLTQKSKGNNVHPMVTSTPERPSKKSPPLYQGGKGYGVGELVWGQVEGYSVWPGMVQVWKTRQASDGMRKVEWFGDGLFSEVNTEGLIPFAAFAQCFCANSFATLTTYRDAIFQSLQVSVERCRKVFSLGSDDRDEHLRVMLDWAFGGFKPTGPEGFRPPLDIQTALKKETLNGKTKVTSQKSSSFSVMKPTSKSSSPDIQIPTKLKQVSVCLNKLSLNMCEDGSFNLPPPESDSDVDLDPKHKPQPRCVKSARAKKIDPDFQTPDSDSDVDPEPKPQPPSVKAAKWKKTDPEYQPPHKRPRSYYKAAEESKAYVQPNQMLREEMVRKVLDKGKDIEKFCLCCGTDDIEIFHPLFEGSLCSKCKGNFTETLYRYDEDGYQSYCTVCCSGLEVILCGHDSCCRSFCLDCLNILVGPGTFDSLKEMDPWICYLCQPNHLHGTLKPRLDWSIRVQTFFANNSAMEFEPHRVYPSIPANLRRPIRVLSLFDGIATGYLVLKDLGFKVETYVASEICEESIAVSVINHDGKIIHVDDVREITKQHIEKWGPFDLLIGGSPCNDLSIVNPARKGLYEGSGRLFFEYYRLLHILKPKEKDPRPFFWLFENVVFMAGKDKDAICRFLECNPVLLDAVKVSPAHRARYFWGNIPGMNRPIIASQKDKLSLQDCLEVGREAKYIKVRTITTKSNSLKQGKAESKCPVMVNGKEDNLWITELEKIFGFPKHYTDVKNMNRQQRQMVLGKSWSVPVIRHLFAPLKDYFACEQLPPYPPQPQGFLATATEMEEERMLTGRGAPGYAPLY